MSDKKNIDRLFQEKFKDFEPIPDNQIWNSIEKRLNANEKESKKIIPFWWRLGGIAAGLALLFTLGYSSFFKTDDILSPVQEIITDVDNKSEEKPLINTKDKFENSNSEKIKEEIIAEDQNSSTKQSKVISSDESKISTRKVVNQANNKQDSFRKKSEEKNINTENKNERIASLETVENPDLKDKEKRLIAKNDSDKKKNNINSFIKKEVVDEELSKKKSNDVAGLKEDKSNKKKKSLLEAIEEQKKLKEEIITKDELEKRWSLAPSVAPVLFSSLSNGSPISSQFADNAKSGDINLSYGINVSYKVNKRLSIRSGINKVNYGYDTNNLTVSPTSSTSSLFDGQTQAIQNVNLNSRASNITINDAQNKSVVASESNSFNNSLFFANAPEADAVLTQELGYLEVPLELKYRVIDKKLGVNLIGGVSSLFLTDNSIVLQSESFTSEVGEATNLNSTNFSTNIGIGIDYNVSDKVQFNLEPVFKYQLNTFSDNGGNFRPYTLGIYTGFSFRF